MLKFLVALELHDAIGSIKLDDIPFLAAMCAGMVVFTVLYVWGLRFFDWLYEGRLGLKKADWLTALSAMVAPVGLFVIFVCRYAP